jgi:hypothetical protein
MPKDGVFNRIRQINPASLRDPDSAGGDAYATVRLASIPMEAQTSSQRNQLLGYRKDGSSAHYSANILTSDGARITSSRISPFIRSLLGTKKVSKPTWTVTGSIPDKSIFGTLIEIS